MIKKIIPLPPLYLGLLLLLLVTLSACNINSSGDTEVGHQILLDENGDRLKSSSDIPLQGVEVNLFSSTHELLGQSTSDREGYVFFMAWPEGSYLTVESESLSLATNSALSCDSYGSFSLCSYEPLADISDLVSLNDLTTQAIEENTFYIINTASQFCAQVSRNSLDDGANVQQHTCVVAPRQQWQVSQVAGGYRLTAAHSGKAMTVALASTADGANVEQETWNASSNQIWDIVQTGDTYKLVALHSGKCLQVKNNRTGKGETLLQNSCADNATGQVFSFALVPPTAPPPPPPSPLPAPTPNPNCGGLVQEAEDGILFGAIQRTAFSNASGGFFVHTPDGDQAPFLKDSMTEPGAAHRMEYCFTVTQAGVYALKTFVAGFDDSDDSFWVQINDNEPFQYLFSDVRNIRNLDPNPFPNFTQDYASDRQGNDPVTISLDAGEHSVRFFFRESDSRLDKLELELLEATGGPVEPSCAGLFQEAESAVLTGDFNIQTSANASGGAFIETPEAPFKFQPTAPNPHSASWCFTVPESGEYVLKAAVRFTDVSHNSFHVVINDNFANTYLWDVAVGDFVDDFLKTRGGPDPAVLNLSAGEQKIVFYQREDGTRVDTLELIKLSQ